MEILLIRASPAWTVSDRHADENWISSPSRSSLNSNCFLISLSRNRRRRLEQNCNGEVVIKFQIKIVFYNKPSKDWQDWRFEMLILPVKASGSIGKASALIVYIRFDPHTIISTLTSNDASRPFYTKETSFLLAFSFSLGVKVLFIVKSCIIASRCPPESKIDCRKRRKSWEFKSIQCRNKFGECFDSSVFWRMIWM